MQHRVGTLNLRWALLGDLDLFALRLLIKWGRQKSSSELGPAASNIDTKLLGIMQSSMGMKMVMPQAWQSWLAQFDLVSILEELLYRLVEIWYLPPP